jgi:hypothetical protein
MGKSKLPSFWLDDSDWEPPKRRMPHSPREFRQRVVATRPRNNAGPGSSPTSVAKREAGQEMVVSLHLSLPHIKLPNVDKLYQKHKKRILTVAGAAAMVGVLAVGLNYLIHRGQTTANKTPKTASEQAIAQAAFVPLIPLDGAGDNTSAKTDYKYDTEKQVLGYSTQFAAASITVSQQQLPEKFQDDGELAKLAQSMSAGTPIETQNGSAYIATNQKANTQTAVFATKEVLVFLHSNRRIDTEDWRLFINQLNPESKH